MKNDEYKICIRKIIGRTNTKENSGKDLLNIALYNKEVKIKIEQIQMTEHMALKCR